MTASREPRMDAFALAEEHPHPRRRRHIGRGVSVEDSEVGVPAGSEVADLIR